MVLHSFICVLSTVSRRPDSRRLRAALETLGALGPHCPDLASRHAPGVASAVLDRLLPRAPHEVSGSGRGAARDGTGRAGTWADPSPGVVLKAAAMKALTRMLLPDPSPAEGGVGGGVDAGLPEWPALLSVLASRVVPALESLSDPLSETGPAGEVGNGEAARLRLAAFTCLFRIVRRADARAPQVRRAGSAETVPGAQPRCAGLPPLLLTFCSQSSEFIPWLSLILTARGETAHIPPL